MPLPACHSLRLEYLVLKKKGKGKREKDRIVTAAAGARLTVALLDEPIEGGQRWPMVITGTK